MIYESPDGGETVYAREIGSDQRHLHHQSETAKRRIEDMRHRQLWYKIHQAARHDEGLQALLDQVETYYLLRNSP